MYKIGNHQKSHKDLNILESEIIRYPYIIGIGHVLHSYSISADKYS